MIKHIPGLNMFIIYDLIIAVFALVYLPVYLFKGKFHSGFKMRLGILPVDIELNGPIWIHAVSVGEAMAAKNLVKELKAAYPHKRFFITTVTPTGNKIASGFAKENDFVAYCPLDLSFIVRRVVEKIKPSLFIVMETEIWPNLISCLHHKKIPILLVNGRLSDRSFKGYSSIKFLLKPVLNMIDLFCVQASIDQERLVRLGVSKDKIHVTGNMKFDNADYSNRKLSESGDKYKSLLEIKPADRLWVCGSTHPGEEEILLDVYKELLGEFPDLKLLIAPRHPERAGKIQELVSSYRFHGVLASRFPHKSSNDATKPVFVLDTIGELLNYYNIADIVFVGGSLIKKGGHNILEPASLSKPVITGPHMFNFRDISELFLANKACLSASNEEELGGHIKFLLNNPGKAHELGWLARQIVLQNQGATARNMKFIINYLPS
jgi:3-deoxy-D-manno-octulosonic-acid transferase